MAWLQQQPTRERPDTFTQTVVVTCLRTLHGRGGPYISADDVLQHLLVERQVDDDLLQPAVLFLKLTQSLHLRRHQAGVLLPPIVVRRLADPAFRQISPTAVPSSPCRRMKAICDSVNFDLFMVLARPTAHAAKLEFSNKDRSKKQRSRSISKRRFPRPMRPLKAVLKE